MLLISLSPYLLVCALALGLRLLLWSQPLHEPANDEVEYITVARDLLAGRGWVFYESYRWLRAPLYPLFLAGSLWLAGDDLHRAALPNIVISVATVYLSYRLALLLVGRRAALLAAFLTAILWTHVTFASLYMAETLFTFLFTASLVCLLEARRRTKDEGRRIGGHGDTETRRHGGEPFLTPSPRHLVILSSCHLVILSVAGVLFGLATLTRSATLLFLPFVMLWLLLDRRRTDVVGTKDDRRRTTDEGRPTKDDRRTDDDRRRTDNGWTADGGHRGLVLQQSKIQNPKSKIHTTLSPFYRLSAVACFVLATALTIAPWTIRNTIAYGSPILVETGLSFNLWFFSEPREDNDTIYNTLASIRNPAERSDYATAKGLERLREDPAIMLRKLWPNWVYLVRVKPIQDRFLYESYYQDIELPLFAAALIFDDALYVVIALAAIAGLALGGRRTTDGGRPTNDEGRRTNDGGRATDRRKTEDGRRTISSLQSPISKWLCLAWIAYMIFTILLTHGEARYRHFLFPVLIPYAAWTLSSLKFIFARASGGHGGPALHDPFTLSPFHPFTPLRLVIVIATVTLFLWTFLPSYPWEWAQQNVARGWHVLAGDVAWRFGDRAGALQAYERALDADDTPDVWLRIGDLARAGGDRQAALEAYEEANETQPRYVAATATLGDLLRELGEMEQAREAFAGYFTDSQEVLDWSWRELQPVPTTAINVGAGLDFGYIAGVYPAEELQGATARWTNGSGALRLKSADDPTRSTQVLHLRLAAPWPDQRPVATSVCVAEMCKIVHVGPEWRAYTLAFAPVRGETFVAHIRSATFDAPGRRLGVLIDWARVE
jgi:tetratricopeptide (TPR) repeat protein